MTTAVTVETAEHPASVLSFPLIDGEPVGGEVYTQLGVVEPHSQQTFHAHGGADILVRELPKPDLPVEYNGTAQEIERAEEAA